MALITCPECGGPVSTEAETCPRCGIPPPRHRAPAPVTSAPVSATQDKGLMAGWACLFVGAALSSTTLSLCGGPFFVASFVLAIVALARGRVLAGILLLLFTILAPLIVLTSWTQGAGEP